MNAPKLLIDTNILIGLEDNKEIETIFSSLQQKCQSNSVQLWIHEASREDIERDEDNPRKNIILSKIAKFPELKGIPVPEVPQLEAVYGKITKPNDYVDVVLLHTLHDVGAVDFLVTQDRGIHKRAAQLGISHRIFTVEDALVWLRDKYERLPVSLPFIEEKQCQQINRDDDIFISLQNDYNGFINWFNNSCVRNHRHCWTINFSDEIAGIAIRKDETLTELYAALPPASDYFKRAPNKILKICTFKIKEKFRGEKFGEQLLKQILWWGHKNHYDLVYLSIYPKHKQLVDLLSLYGFQHIGRTGGEIYLAKAYKGGILNGVPPLEPVAYHRQYYPAYLSTETIEKYLIPIRSGYYAQLFPENINVRQAGLFDNIAGDTGNRIPGNTIRKVYVCHAQINKMKLGDILLFFHLKDSNSFESQTLVTVGIVDGFDITDKSDVLLRLTAKRSVFNQDKLEEFTAQGTKKVKVINFLFAGHIKPAITYSKLQELGIIGPYQSIRSVPHAQFQQLESVMNINV